MFDIGFMELLLIGIVALLVLGPDKLPGAIRTGALWLGRARRSFNKVKAEIEQQLNTDEIRRQLHNESILADIDKAKKSADKLIRDAKEDIKETQNAITASTAKLTTSAEEGIPTPPPEPAVSKERAQVDERYRKLADSSDEPDAAESDDTSTAAVSDDVVASEDHDRDIGSEKPEPETAPDHKTKKAPVQDFYNTPPQGIVSFQDGKISATDKKPKAGD
jgi:sec-independent protein translocase protein TatB